MCFFKKCRAKRAAKKQLKEEAKTKQQEEVVLNEKNVEEVKKKQAKVNKPVEAKKADVKETPAKAEEPIKKEAKQRYHVAQNKDSKSPNYKKWGVRLSSSKKTIKFHDTQLEAIKHAEELAENNNTTIVIHKLDGSIRKQNY